MKLSDLIAELMRFPYQHALTYTNVEAVICSGTDAFLETDVSNLNASIKAHEDSERELNDEIHKLEENEDRMTDELNELRNIMADLKDPESGVTVAQFKERCEKAEADSTEAWKYARVCEAELKALRKRKGIEPELFANGRELIEVVREIANDKTFENHRLRPRAEAVSKKINGWVPREMP